MKWYWWILIVIIILAIAWAVIRFTPPRRFFVGKKEAEKGADIAYMIYTFEKRIYWKQQVGDFTGGTPPEKITKEEWWNAYKNRDK